ncbi:MAG TPA: VCBS repeat-containing protein, partial [Thermoplasmata archaeon]|nr:VCBS repeat-containing protein [Thermoplasmata archaeon]
DFTVTIKVKDSSGTEYTLVNNQTNGNGGLTITRISANNYKASYSWDPADSQTLGDYDLYFYVKDSGGLSTQDKYSNNTDELTLLNGYPRISFANTASSASTATNDVRAVAVGDLDLDGKMDIAFADGTSVKIIQNDGSPFDGSWNSAVTVGTCDGNVRDIAIGDLDNDGWPDLIVTDAGGWQKNNLFKNDGTPFNGAWSTVYRWDWGGNDPVAVGDLDNDGYLDLLVGNTGGVWECFRNDGTPFDGGWTRNALPSQTSVEDVALADLDNDGDLDAIAVSDSTNDRVTIAENDGTPFTGSWNDYDIGTPGVDVNAVAVGDLDNDGWIDVVAGNRNSEIVIYENDGTSIFSTPWNSNRAGGTTYYVSSLELVDLDLDGYLDIVASSETTSSNNIQTFQNDGSPFTDEWLTVNIGTASNTVYKVAVGDLDNDGDTDIVSGADSVGSVEVQCWNNSLIHRDASFYTWFSLSTTSDATYTIAAGDVDNDGDIDIAVGNYGGQNVLYINDGDGTFDTTSYNFGTGSDNTRALAFGDFNNDGLLDIAVANYNQQNRVYINDGSGNPFDGSSNTFGSSSSNTYALAVGDVDNDGALDIATGEYYTNYLYLGNGDGTFGTGNSWGLSTGLTYAVDLGDFNNDGDLDIVEANYNYSNYAYVGDGDGTFSTQYKIGQGTSSWTSYDVEFSDLNNDGKLDVIFGNYNSQNKVVLHDNSGNPYDTAANEINYGSSSSATRSISVQDFNHDGIADIAVGNYNQQNKVYLGDGDGTFDTTSINVGPSSSDTYAISGTDINSDSKIDILCGNYNARNRVYNNTGGQLNYTVTDTSPTQMLDSAKDDLLKIVVKHNGISEDNDAEIYQWNLLFEENDGDPLTTSEANAIIETLYIYLDDGDGVWENNGDDTIVKTISSLYLSSGVQQITFTDGDANVKIAATESKTYFIVVELTSDASTQTPHTFQITFDPDEDSVNEDRDEDSRVTVEHTEPVTTNNIEAIPEFLNLMLSISAILFLYFVKKKKRASLRKKLYISRGSGS